MSGLFAQWQPRYAELGIATFPVREKKPAVKHYLKVGVDASSEYAHRFANDNAFGIACRRSLITVLDVDSPDERLLADAMSEVGPTPFVVRSGSGNFQAWYRHNGEKRRVRPDPLRPIDILGDGFVVAPPSLGSKGGYCIVSGSLDDLLELPKMRIVQQVDPAMSLPQAELVAPGRRNQTLWRECMKRARACSTITELMEVAVSTNQELFYEPLPAEEVLSVVASAWAKELSGENWFGIGGRVIMEAAEVDDLLNHHEDAFLLLARLRRHHWGREFVIANAMADSIGWTRKRLAAARQFLVEAHQIEEVRPASRYGGPAVFRFKGGQK